MDTDTFRLERYAEDLILSSGSLELTPSEKKQLSTLKFSKLKDSWKEQVEFDRVDGLLATPFIKDFLSARNLDWELVSNADVLRFGTVNMHTDYGPGSNVRSLLVFLYGKGELAAYTDSSKKIEYFDLEKHSVVLFDPSKPHAFINKNKTLCWAIVADLKIKSGT